MAAKTGRTAAYSSGNHGLQWAGRALKDDFGLQHCTGSSLRNAAARATRRERQLTTAAAACKCVRI